jgi:hypothetical protein
MAKAINCSSLTELIRSLQSSQAIFSNLFLLDSKKIKFAEFQKKELIAKTKELSEGIFEKIFENYNTFELSIGQNHHGEIEDRLQKSRIGLSGVLSDDLFVYDAEWCSWEDKEKVQLLALNLSDIFPLNAIRTTDIMVRTFINKALAMGLMIAPKETIFSLALDVVNDIPGSTYTLARKPISMVERLYTAECTMSGEVKFSSRISDIGRVGDDEKCFVFQLPDELSEQFALAKKLNKIRDENIMQEDLRLESGFMGGDDYGV